MILSFHPCFDADYQIILGDRHLTSVDLELMRRAKAIILPQGRPKEVYEACAGLRAAVFPDYALRFAYPGKTGQSRLFERFQCPYPTTLRWPTIASFMAAHPVLERCPHRVPFLFKTDRGHEGEGVYFVDTGDAFLAALEELSRKEVSGLRGFVTQDYVPCGGNALRAVIIGERVLTYWKRPVHRDGTITTISRGARVDHAWRPELQEKGKREASRFAQGTGINLAAIDFVFSMEGDDPEPLFLEINYYFGRRGLGGSERYYGMVFEAVRDWLKRAGLQTDSVRLV
jgi:ribosomal protein S6--L-glutamate ligase